MEYAEKGSLEKLLGEYKKLKKTFKESEILRMFANMAFPLLEANSRGIMHRDFRPDNMLV